MTLTLWQRWRTRRAWRRAWRNAASRGAVMILPDVSAPPDQLPPSAAILPPPATCPICGSDHCSSDPDDETTTT